MFVEEFTTAGSILDDKTYVVSKTGISCGLLGTETAVMQIRNPSGSDRTLRIGRVAFGTTSASFGALMTMYTNPTVTSNGTVLAPAPLLVANPAASAANCYSSPTCSSFGTFLAAATSTMAGTMGAIDFERLLIVPANNVLLITCTPAISGATMTLNVVYLEY